MVTVNWQGGMVFEAIGETGVAFQMDSHPEFGGQRKGPTPVEALLGSAAACSAIDVVSILEKQRQHITSYRIEVEGVRPAPGTYPRPFSEITIRHILTGNNLDHALVEKAVKLSDEKYCTVVTTLRNMPKVVSFAVVEEIPGT
jgi:putative redox protein